MEMEAQRRPRMRRKSGAGRIVIIILLVIAAGVGGTLFYLHKMDERAEAQRQAILFSDSFRPGTQVGGVDVSDMTYAKAAEALRAKQDEVIGDMQFTLSCKGSTYTTSPDFFAVTSNADEQLKAAFTLAREDITLEALQAELADIAANGRTYDVTYTVEPVQEKFETLIQSISAAVDTAPIPASAAVKQLPLDSETGLPACFNIGMPEEGVTASDGSVTKDVRDLRFTFTAGQNGWGVNHDELYEAIVERTHNRQWGTIDVPLGEIEPEVDIQALKDTQLVLRGYAVTKYSGSSSRVFNIKKAVGLVYGKVLLPGEQYTHNGTLGDRTEAGGWQLAPAVIDGGANHEDQAGGGVCQTSTTLYQAVLKGDLQVDSRRGHSTKSSYAEGGLDCTVADSTTGNIDFLWTNNTESPLYVFMWLNTKTKRCYAEIYGQPLPAEFDEIQLYSELVETIMPTADVYTQKATLTYPYWQQGNKAKEGYSYDAYKLYMKDGVEIRRVKVDNTVYKMHPARFFVYPGWVGEPLDPLYQLPYEKDE